MSVISSFPHWRRPGAGTPSAWGRRVRPPPSPAGCSCLILVPPTLMRPPAHCIDSCGTAAGHSASGPTTQTVLSRIILPWMRAAETHRQGRSRTTSWSRNSCCHRGPMRPKRIQTTQPGTAPPCGPPRDVGRRVRAGQARACLQLRQQHLRQHPGWSRHDRRFAAAASQGCPPSHCVGSAARHAGVHHTNPIPRSVNRATRRLYQQPAAAAFPSCPRNSPRPDLPALLLLLLLLCCCTAAPLRHCAVGCRYR